MRMMLPALLRRLKPPPESGCKKNLRLLLNRKYGVDIAGGQGKMANEIFRIGHLGGAISELDIITTIAALEMSLLELGYNLELGSGVSEAQKVIMNM